MLKGVVSSLNESDTNMADKRMTYSVWHVVKILYNCLTTNRYPSKDEWYFCRNGLGFPLSKAQITSNLTLCVHIVIRHLKTTYVQICYLIYGQSYFFKLIVFIFGAFYLLIQNLQSRKLRPCVYGIRDVCNDLLNIGKGGHLHEQCRDAIRRRNL